MISNTLDIVPYQARLAELGRVQITDFLQEDSARKLRQCLREEVPWELAQRADRPPLLDPAKLQLAPAAQDLERLREAIRRARSGFEFAFDRYRMIEARRDGLDPHLVLHVVVDFLNSQDFLEFARELTGDPDIRMVSAIASRYRPGHFLRMHDDKAHEEDRAFAYVINLSQGWEADWGGLLQFVDQKQNVLDTFTPHWNSLSLFRVPHHHVVTQVTPWALDARYSITGWLRRS